MTVLTFLTILMQGPISDPNATNNYLLLGYVVMWIIGAAYVVSLAARQRNVRQDIEMLQQLLQDDEDTAV